VSRKLMEPEKITDHLYLVGSSDLTDGRDCSVYLLDLGELLLIDTGAGPSAHQIIRNIERTGLDPDKLSTIILTHCHIDHVGGAQSFRDRFNSRIVMHSPDAQILEQGDPRMTAAFWYNLPLQPLTIDVKLEKEEETLQIGGHEILCLHTPGHTPGSLSVCVDLDGSKILFGQDIHGPFYAEFGSNLTAWHASMKRLLALSADILCEGHFGVYRPADRVRAYIEHYVDEHEGER
jgi:glyoxylase-like metal-dependent hydrolase (beta-lactamase superfamily II)